MKGLYTKGQHQQSGTTLVEFTIVATLFFILLFSIIEFSRLLYVWHGLNETSRRTARLAAVCQVSATEQEDVKNLALMESVTLPGLTTANLQLQYLDSTGTPIGGDLTSPGNFGQIRFVRASIVGYQLTLLIPLVTIDLDLLSPDFSTTLPRESLGVTPVDYTDC